MPNAQIAITMSDGTLTLLTFLTEGRSPTVPVGAVLLDSGLWRRAPTADALAAEFAKAFPPVDQLGQPKPQPVAWTIVPPAAVPTDRTYRNAWRHDGTVFSHDLDHARRIHLDHVRHARTEYFGQLDRDWMRATARGDSAAAGAIEAERQQLRDAPATLAVDDAQTVDDLKTRWPEGLPRR